MSPHCTESTIRKAADWREFKHGSELVAMVTDAVASSTGWRGAVRDGRRPLRVSVVAKSATDIEARCPCRENQSTGAFCRHAVAVGLALAAGKSQPAPKPQPPARTTPTQGDHTPTPTKPTPKHAWNIEFPPPWQRMLTSGRLAVKVARNPDAEVDSADAALSEYLTAAKAPNGGMLQLDGSRLIAFLAAAAAHPRITAGGQPVEVVANARLRIASVEPDGDGHVVITPAAQSACRIGDAILELADHRIAWVAASLPDCCAPLARGITSRVPMREFLARAEAWGETLEWPQQGWLSSLTFVAEIPRIEITLSASSHAIEARPLVRYGDGGAAVPPGHGDVPELPALQGARCSMRNHHAEATMVSQLENLGFSRLPDALPPVWKLNGENAIADFINVSLPSLEAQYTIHHGTGLAQRIRDAARATPKFDVVASGEDWLQFDLSFQADDSNKKTPKGDMWRLLKSGGAEGRRKVSRIASELIEPLFAELDLTQENGSFIARGASAECIHIIRKYSDNLNNQNELSKNEEPVLSMPSSIQADLRPYQHQGAAWITDRLQRYGGALLADDMGLGKTIQSIVSIERLFEADDSNEHSVLVVATTSLLGNWEAEFGRFAPARRVRVLHGTKRDLEKEQARGGEAWLTSYATLARDLAWHLRQTYLAVVVDEASLMRNPDTDHSKALFKLNALNRLALTGTPVENGVRDLWSIFRFIQPGWLGGRREFQDRYETPAGQVADPWALRRLAVRTAPFTLRRTKDEVARDLPAKIHINEVVELSRKQQAVYRELLTEGRRYADQLADAGQKGAARMLVLTALLRLRQACCDLALLKDERFKQLEIASRSAKIERLLELVNSAVAGNHKMLIFSQFKTQLREIRECLIGQGVDCLVLDGETRNRQECVDRFQSADGPPVFLISLKAGGYGLNLTAADVVVHFDPWWNPAAEAQATDRAHRIGQTRPVTVYRLLARGTVEEKVVALQQRKRAVAMAVDAANNPDESGGGDAPGWNEQELVELFG